MKGHSSYYYLDLAIIAVGAFLALTGEPLIGGLLFVAGTLVHFDWLGLRMFQ